MEACRLQERNMAAACNTLDTKCMASSLKLKLEPTTHEGELAAAHPHLEASGCCVMVGKRRLASVAEPSALVSTTCRSSTTPCKEGPQQRAQALWVHADILGAQASIYARCPELWGWDGHAAAPQPPYDERYARRQQFQLTAPRAPHLVLLKPLLTLYTQAARARHSSPEH